MHRVLLLAALLLAGVAPQPASAQQAGAYRSASPITPGTPVPPGDAVLMSCSAPGNLRVQMQDGSFADFYVLQGSVVVDNFAVIGVNALATTATCTVAVLRRSL